MAAGPKATVACAFCGRVNRVDLSVQSMAPTLDALASEQRGRVLVAKLDTDANPGTAASFGIRGHPQARRVPRRA